MTLRTGEDILIWRSRLWIALCGGIILEEALDLSSDRILNEWIGILLITEQNGDISPKKKISMYLDTFPGKWPECAGRVPWLLYPPWWTLLNHSLWGVFFFTKWATFLEYLQQPTSCSNATEKLETSGLDMPWPIYDPSDYGWPTCRITNGTDFENLQTI